MSYQSDMRGAALRLWCAALQLKSQHLAVAAYLFGLTAECALKFVAASLPNGTRDEVQWAHFPPLRTALRNIGQGRGFAGLRRLIESDAFLNQWDISIRYARKEDINNKPIADWEVHAREAIKLMEGT